MSYVEAQLKVDDKKATDRLACDLRLLISFSKVFKQKRLDRGALMLESSNLKFIVDAKTLQPTDAVIYKVLNFLNNCKLLHKVYETNSAIEEMMLLANITVAEKIYESFPHVSCLRNHPAPDPQKFQSLIRTLSKKHFTLSLDSNKALQESLDRIKIDSDPHFNQIIRISCTKCMMLVFLI